MGFLQFILATEPNHRQSKSGRKAGFKINPTAMSGEISDEKFAATNTCDNFIVNLVVVLLTVNSERFISRISDSSFDGQGRGINGFVKPHRDETNLALRIPLTQRIKISPSFWTY